MNSIHKKYENLETQLPRVVTEIGKIHFQGNIIPHEWYNHIKLPSGKPDVVGIIILSEIVYWYRPVTILDEKTGRQTGKSKKFAGDKFRSPIGYYVQKFGFTPDQVRNALDRLVQCGFIAREYRDFDLTEVKITNLTFVEPVVEKILAITHPEPEPFEPEPGPENNPKNGQKLGVEPISNGAVPAPQGTVPAPQGAVPAPPIIDFTKTSAKISITTTTEALPNSRDLPTDKGSGGSGDLIYPKELLPEERKEATRMLESMDGQAQQLLDELTGQLRVKEIKNPLGYLHRLIARAKEGKFSATAGIKVGESRKRKARTETSLKGGEESASKPLEGPRRGEMWRQLDELRKLRQSLGATSHL